MTNQAADPRAARLRQLEKALIEICQRLEAKISADTETHRELSAERQRRLDAVYAIAEQALAATACLFEVEQAHPEPSMDEKLLALDRERIVELEVALAEARAALSRQWQPIETAPKDGRVLLYVPGEEYSWRFQVGEWDGDIRIYDSDSQASRAYSRTHQPTHWVPLPSPPEIPS